MGIKSWPVGEQPREKLIAKGAESLSDAELLAIFLRTGVKGKSAVDLARELIERFGSLRALLSADRKTFCANKGLGVVKYVQLQAVLEMATRHVQQNIIRENILSSPNDTRRFLLLKMRDLQQEVFACLFLDSKHRVVAFEEMFHGTIDSAGVYPREIIKSALAHNAAAIILAHNHPSGDTEPSLADRSVTKCIKDAAQLLDIRLLDHFIVGDGVCFSFAEKGLL